MSADSNPVKSMAAFFFLVVVSMCAGCSSSAFNQNWYYHWNCNGDAQCLASNPGGTPSGTVGPISGGLSGCNDLLTLAANSWGAAATNSCDNLPIEPHPAITDFTPAVGAPGTTVTITGSNFATDSTVTINAITAPVISASATQIVVTIPPMANFSGPFMVVAPGGTVTSASSFSVINALFGVAWSGTRFIAVGGTGVIDASPEGVTWSAMTSGVTRDLRGIAWSGTQFVAVGAGGTILTSPTGVTWTPQNSGTSSGLNGVAGSGTQFVAVGDGGTILTSPDGVTWTSRVSGTTARLNAVNWSGTLYVVVGAPTAAPAQLLYTSPDGVTWTAGGWWPGSAGSGPAAGLVALTWSGTQFGAVGGNTITTSPQGTTWTTQTSGTTSSLSAIAWSGTRYVVAGTGGTLLTSPTGTTWTAQASGVTDSLNGIVWSGTQFLVVGANGALLTSPEGFTWTVQTPP